MLTQQHPGRGRGLPPSLRQIIAATSLETGVKTGEILGPCRRADICKARFAIIMAARNRPEPFLPLSYPRIGRALGDRHHTTIISGHRRAKRFAVVDRTFRELVSKVAR